MKAKTPWTTTHHKNGNVDVILPSGEVLTLAYRNDGIKRGIRRVGPRRNCTSTDYAHAVSLAQGILCARKEARVQLPLPFKYKRAS